MSPRILTINGGSSSIKFAIFTVSSQPQRLFSGQVERIGLSGTKLTAMADSAGAADSQSINADTFTLAARNLIEYLDKRIGRDAIAGIGHRVVHGGIHLLDNQLVTREMIEELKRTQPLDLAHLPREISLIEAFGEAYESIPQVACFDTAFHRDLPRVAQLLPIPLHYFEKGIRRFGFHGLSYTYLMGRLAEVAGADAANGRVILAHLGSGASMAAVRERRPVETTMGFTPTSGLVMGTRPGDLDPGLLVYMMRALKMSPDEMDAFISQKCGLLGISETTSDMRDLIARRTTDARAADAVDLFCYQARKFIGALSVTLGGLDTLVFSGGIGEHSPEIRAGICGGLQSLGIHLDESLNAANGDAISTPGSSVVVRMNRTDEEMVIAGAVAAFVK